MKCRHLLPLLLAALAGCASAPQAPEPLRQELTEAVLQADSVADAACRERRVVAREFVKTYYAEGLAVLERWSLEGCGRRIEYQVSWLREPARWGGAGILVRRSPDGPGGVTRL